MSNAERIAVFIDGANLYATAKSLGFDIDYKRLLRHFEQQGRLVRAYYYTAIIEDEEYSSIRPLVDWLDLMAMRSSPSQPSNSSIPLGVVRSRAI